MKLFGDVFFAQDVLLECTLHEALPMLLRDGLDRFRGSESRTHDVKSVCWMCRLSLLITCGRKERYYLQDYYRYSD
jgi:hypothetical protein